MSYDIKPIFREWGDLIMSEYYIDFKREGLVCVDVSRVKDFSTIAYPLKTMQFLKSLSGSLRLVALHESSDEQEDFFQTGLNDDHVFSLTHSFSEPLVSLSQFDLLISLRCSS